MLRKGDRLHVQGVGTPLPNDTEQNSPRGHVARSLIRTLSRRSTRYWENEWTSHPDGSISYQDVLFGSLTSAAIRWCVRMPCPDIFCSLHSGFAYGKGLQSFASSCFWAFHCFAMDSKELSLISINENNLKLKIMKINVSIWWFRINLKLILFNNFNA